MRRIIALLIVLAPLTSFAQFDFQSPVLIKCDATAYVPQPGDFNGDGKIDVAYWVQSQYTVNTAGKKLMMVLNHGNNNYEKKVIVSKTEDTLVDFRVGDLNDDGIDDIVAFNYVFDAKESHLFTFLSEGDHFNETIIPIHEGLYGSLRITDFDNDEDMDVLLSDQNSPVSFFENDGKGGFTRRIIEDVVGTTYSFEYLDIDGDGEKDFVTAWNNKIKFFIKDGDGYTASERSIVAGTADMTVFDYDGDELPDIAISNYPNSTIDVYHNKGDVTFDDPVSLTDTNSKNPLRMYHIDYDNDGREDLFASTTWSPGAVVYRNTASGFEFVGPASGDDVPAGALVADMDGDEVNELVFVTDTYMSIFEQENDDFTLDFKFQLTFRAARGQVADIDNDGHPDIVSDDGRGGVTIHYGEANFQFESKFLKLERKSFGRLPVVGDFNEDGAADIVHLEGDDAWLYLANGRNFSQPQAVEHFPVLSYAPADYNNDGHLDYVETNSVMLGDGTGQFTKITFPLPSFVNSYLSRVANLNNDNFPDLLVYGGDAKIYSAINTGTTPYFPTFIPTGASGDQFFNYPGFNSGLLNDDKLTDFVAYPTGNTFSYYINNGDGTFTGKSVARSPGVFTTTPYIADLDGDGKGEIIAAFNEPDGPGFEVYKLNPTGDLVVAKVRTNLYEPRCVIVSDLDKNQKPEVILFDLTLDDAITIFPLLAQPTISPSNLNAHDITKTTANLTLTKGNGSSRIIIVREKVNAALIPEDNNFYESDETHLIFSGDIDEAALSDLKKETTYVANAYEYNTTWDNNSIDYMPDGPQLEFTTASDTKKQQTITFTIIDQSINNAPITLSATTTSGLPLTFTATTTNISITNGVLSFTTPGPATVKVSQAGNDEYQPAEIQVTFCVNPLVPTIFATTTTLTSSSDTNNQWLLNDVDIPNAVNKTYTPTVTGNYKVTVDYSGCSSTSESTAFSITGLEDRDQSITFYPNPVKGTINIDFGHSDHSNEVVFTDILGRRHSLTGSGVNQLSIDISPLSRGQYIVEVNAKESIFRRRIIVE